MTDFVAWSAVTPVGLFAGALALIATGVVSGALGRAPRASDPRGGPSWGSSPYATWRRRPEVSGLPGLLAGGRGTFCTGGLGAAGR